MKVVLLRSATGFPKIIYICSCSAQMIMLSSTEQELYPAYKLMLKCRQLMTFKTY